MTVRLKKIHPIQAGKMLGAIYGIAAIVIAPFLAVSIAFGSQQQDGPRVLVALALLILLPLAYAAASFVMGALAAVLYNLTARWLGGLEFEAEPTPGAAAQSGLSPPLPPTLG